MNKFIRFIVPRLPVLVLAGLIGGVSLSMSVGLLAASAWLISMASTQPPILVLEVAIVSVRFFGLGRGVVRYFGRIQEHEAALSLQTVLRQKIYESLESRQIRQLVGVRSGQLIQDIGANSELVQDLWLRLFIPWISALIAGVSGIGIISWLEPSLGRAVSVIFLCVMTIIPILAISTGTGKAQKYEKKMQDEFHQACDALEESLVFGEAETIQKQMTEIQRSVSKTEIRNSKTAGIAEATHYIILGFTVLMALTYASAATSNGKLAGVNIAVLALVPLAMFDGLPALYAAFSNFKLLIERAKSLSPYLERIEVNQFKSINESGLKRLEVFNLLPSTVKGRVEPISFTLEPGIPLLISGRSGSGKSSILNSILNFVSYEGQVMCEGDVVALLQNDHLFMTSIRENLKISSPTSDDAELWEILDAMELGELIRSLPQGLDTHVGEYGYNFSGGERQRLKLGRILLSQSDIYLLDEPFEYLDEEMAHRLAMRVARILANKRVLIVSHLPLKIEGRELTLRVTA